MGAGVCYHCRQAGHLNFNCPNSQVGSASHVVSSQSGADSMKQGQRGAVASNYRLASVAQPNMTNSSGSKQGSQGGRPRTQGKFLL